MISNRKRYALFLGCIIPLRLPFIESSTRAVFKNLGIELKDIEGASCCPAPGIFKKIDEMSWLTIAARNLSLAERMKLDIVTLCNGCLLTLSEANNILKNDQQLRYKVNKILSEDDLKYRGSITAYHFIDVLAETLRLNAIKALIKRPLKDIKVAPFYGCHYLTYRKRILDLQKPPLNLEKLIDVTGAVYVDYEDKWACCGAGEGLRSSTPLLANIIGRDKMARLIKSKVNCIVNICPFCHLQLNQINESLGHKKQVRVFHYNQLLGLAMDVPTHILGLEK
ncbi:CoB--CoM heterodisulfide reductase iron-sulfur subunit B family protein [[Eubacterium] cellulosolvens]